MSDVSKAPEERPTTAVERDVIDLAPAATEANADASSGEEISQEEIEHVTAEIIKALKTVYDPEIPVDIYELGLIYKVDYSESRFVDVDMTLTAPGCPVAGEMPGWVEEAIKEVEGVSGVKVSMTFDPPWTMEMMSDEAKLHLGWM